MITGAETSLLARGAGRGMVLHNPAFPVVASDPSPSSLLTVLHQLGKKELGQSSLAWSLQANVQRDVTNDVESRVPGKGLSSAETQSFGHTASCWGLRSPSPIWMDLHTQSPRGPQ